MIIKADASPVSVGAVLLKKNKNNKIYTLFFANRKLSETEQRYSQIDWEVLYTTLAETTGNEYCFLASY